MGTNDLIPGQHIYVRRPLGYTHHGIYVGRDSTKTHVQYVIHLLGDEKKGLSSWGSSSWSSSLGNSKKCEDCGYQSGVDSGVVRTCLNCFMSNGGSLGGTELYLYQYDVPVEKTSSAPGTCSSSKAKPLEEIVKNAYARYYQRSREYNLVLYNCESFATECSTGVGTSQQVYHVATTCNIL